MRSRADSLVVEPLMVSGKAGGSIPPLRICRVSQDLRIFESQTEFSSAAYFNGEVCASRYAKYERKTTCQSDARLALAYPSTSAGFESHAPALSHAISSVAEQPTRILI